MSDKLVDSAKVVELGMDSAVATSGGSLLRKAREASGVQIASLALTLKVPIKKLEALEADRFDLLPDTVFVRALTTSVCRTLKIDHVPILERLPHATTPSLKADASGINTPFRSQGTGSIVSFVNQFLKPFSLVVLVLFVGVLLLIFLPQKLPNVVDDTQGSKNLSLISSAANHVSELEIAKNHSAIGTELPVISANLTQPGSINVVTLNTASGVASAILNAVDVMPPVSDVLTNGVLFKARDTSWVEVVDAKGTVQVRKTMTQGEVIEVSGVIPMAVIVGRASNIDVLVHGQPFDLSTLAKDNVARFEVK